MLLRDLFMAILDHNCFAAHWFLGVDAGYAAIEIVGGEVGDFALFDIWFEEG